MKKLSLSFVILLCAFLCLVQSSCTGSHLINDEAKLKVVTEDFENRRKSLPDGDFFAVFDSVEMSQCQREAMMFLYAYMPLCDIADHSADFYLKNIDYTFKAQREMPWGNDIPEREFLHFVLPLRVNNENLDSCRPVFYEELRERVKGMSMHDAVLEVNHWCHEKVVYTPSDARTSSPLATVRTAYGRCGEESTFTVAALRSIGIPARQVYTPRWAHTDSNHAWVEAWVDGEWRFFGACEPEPVLDLGWFNAPASRAMLMHTKAFGRYDGPEEVMSRNPVFTEINVIDNYAPTSRVDIKVVDTENRPVENATIEFKVYNYAEFFSVATKTTDKNGHSFLTAGRGDMLVWASKDGKYGFSKVAFGKDSEITITLDYKSGDTFSLVLDVIPPAEGANLPEVTEKQRTENSCRMAEEDSIRNAYVATFYTAESALKEAQNMNIEGYDKSVPADMLVKSRGNYEVILSALRHKKEQAAWILSLVSDKDLRDIPANVLADHIDNTPAWDSDITDKEYIAAPRVSNEMLTPYRAFFRNTISEELVSEFRQDPMQLEKWVVENIRIDEDCNRGGAPISPIGVWKAKVADTHSRNIFFVALARSLNIPARVDNVTEKVQLVENGNFIDINFGQSESGAAPQGELKTGYKAVKTLENPKYYSHFSISKISDNGRLQLLNYEEGDASKEGTTWANLLKNGTSMDEGDYLLVTGTRLANGGVLANLTAFHVTENERTDVEMTMRQSLDQVQVIGGFSSETLYKPVGGDAPKSILSTTGRGYFVVAVLGVNQEPTNHALRDIAALAKDFEQWGRQMILLFPSEDDYKQFRHEDFPGLPTNITFGIDIDGAVRNQIIKEMKLTNGTLPLFIIADTFDRVVFFSQGYTIGLGEQLMKTIHKL